MEQDVQEKERMMIGLTGCLDKDILKRFVRQRFILIANRQQLSFDDWRPLCYFVACRCPICRNRVGFMAFLERKFIDICEIQKGKLRNLWILPFIQNFRIVVEFPNQYFSSFKRDDKSFDFSL